MAPVAATSLSGVALENKNIVNIKELTSYIPNFFMPDYGSKLTSLIYVRGIGARINSPSVGLYVDGIPYFDKSFFDINLFEIDRIDVLRGPQGTLYGRNTMGGIINIYTKSPFKYRGTDVLLSAGSYANLDFSASHYNRIGEKFGFSVSGNYMHSDGYFTNHYSNKKVDKLNSGAGRVRLQWLFNPEISLQVISNMDYSKQGGYPYAPYNTETGLPGEVNYDEYSSYERTLSTTDAILDYNKEKFRLSSTTAFQYLSDEQRIDQDFTPQALYFAIQKQKQKMISEELNITSQNSGKYKWLFGAFGFWQGLDSDVEVFYRTLDRQTLKVSDNPTYGVAFYHQSKLEDLFTEGLSFTVGVRYDYEHARSGYDSYDWQSDQQPKHAEDKMTLRFSQVTPKFSIQYLFPSSSQLLFGTITKGYKTGGFNSSFNSDEERTFDPEYSWNYEVGTKLNFWENRIHAEVNLFYIDWKDQQLYKITSSGIGSMLTNVGRSESKGVEFSLDANLFKGFVFHGNYGYTHATFKDYTAEGTDMDYTGNYLPMVPRYTLSIGADYTFSVKSKWMDYFTVNAYYNGVGKL
ncbi:MAG: TonB-dependent receptor, partial [Odoribacter sp.]|nr:TonB-dependent receptor [Odoribacter sp.]